MLRQLATVGLTALLALGLAAGIATAGHHEKEMTPKENHQDHGKHMGHEKKPESAKKGEHEGHGDHKDHGKKPKADDSKK